MSSPSEQEPSNYLQRLSPVQHFICECLGEICNYGLEEVTSEEDLHAYFLAEYSKLSAREQRNLLEDYCKVNLAAGLLSFGHLEVVEELIQALPEERRPKWKGTCVVIADSALTEYLPIPPEFRPPLLARSHMRCNRSEMEDWFRRNQAQLRWDPAAYNRGKFLLQGS